MKVIFSICLFTDLFDGVKPLQKTKIAFLIHDLGHGGAEKVLVNLVNNMDPQKFDITLIALFKGGVNEQFLHDNIHYRVWIPWMIPGNSKIMKLFSPKRLYKMCIKEQFDIVVSYLEGPTARLVSGCPYENTKLVSWIHCSMPTPKSASIGFRSFNEAKKCYSKFHNTVCVSKWVMDTFKKTFSFDKPIEVLYNTIETKEIEMKSCEPLDENVFSKDEINICAVGKVLKSKGCERLVNIQKRLVQDGLKTHTYFLGVGADEEFVKIFAKENALESSITLLGYQTNPYKYVRNCDLFVCASYSEGFSTAATEALIVGTPVVTTDVSGMKEMLGDNNEYGIVTDNDENALYDGIKHIISNPELLEEYGKKAFQRGKRFTADTTTKAVEDMFKSLL